MRAPHARAGSGPSDIPVERTVEQIDAGETGDIPPPPISLENPAGQNGQDADPLHWTGSNPVRPTGNGDAGSSKAEQVLRAALARAQSKLAKTRARISVIEAEQSQIETDRARVIEEQGARCHSLELSLKSLGDELGNTLAERAAVELRAGRLADSLATLQIDLTAAQARAEQSTRLEQHATWAGEQIALLVENEARIAAELDRKQHDTGVLNIRIEGLRTELRSAEADLRAHNERTAEFMICASRLIGGELPPAASALDVLGILHRRMRVLEREIDQETAAREQIAVVRSAVDRSAYATSLRVISSLLEKIGLRRLVPNAFWGT